MFALPIAQSREKQKKRDGKKNSASVKQTIHNTINKVLPYCSFIHIWVLVG